MGSFKGLNLEKQWVRPEGRRGLMAPKKQPKVNGGKRGIAPPVSEVAGHGFRNWGLLLRRAASGKLYYQNRGVERSMAKGRSVQRGRR